MELFHVIGLLEEAKIGSRSPGGDNSVVLGSLQALAHLFSWIPLADINCLQLLSLITHFASQPVSNIFCSVPGST